MEKNIYISYINMENSENNGFIKDIYKTTKREYFNTHQPVMYKTNNSQPLVGIVEETPLSNLFFSDMNKEALQKTMRYRIFKLTNKVISYQSDINLFIIMRSMYLQFANSFVHESELVENVKKINEKVLDYCVDNIKIQLEQHLGYLDKISNAPVPLEHPQYLNKQNYTYDTSNLF